jgi:hypothetical protein
MLGCWLFVSLLILDKFTPYTHKSQSKTVQGFEALDGFAFVYILILPHGNLTFNFLQDIQDN